MAAALPEKKVLTELRVLVPLGHAATEWRVAMDYAVLVEALESIFFYILIRFMSTAN